MDETRIEETAAGEQEAPVYLSNRDPGDEAQAAPSDAPRLADAA